MRKGNPAQEEHRKQMKTKASTLLCPYDDCENHTQSDANNIIFIRKYGKGATQNLFKCMKCKRTFSERKGTALFGCCLPEDKISEITKCLSEGNSIRGTARIVHVSKSTVCSLVKRLGSHMEKVTESQMQNYHIDECQLDELWGFVFKKRKI
jgi:transposase-like protein